MCWGGKPFGIPPLRPPWSRFNGGLPIPAGAPRSSIASAARAMVDPRVHRRVRAIRFVSIASRLPAARGPWPVWRAVGCVPRAPR